MNPFRTRLWPLLLFSILPVFAIAAEKPLSTSEKAELLLNRLAYGPRPGELEKIVHSGPKGLQKWIELQLHPEKISDGSLDQKLASLKTLSLSSAQLEEQYPTINDQLKKMGMDPQAIRDDEVKKREIRKEGKTPEEIYKELEAQKLIRAVESPKQLQEVLTDFWFNHFNVDFTKGEVRYMIGPYERDTIRPHIFGKFRDLLAATAHSPAMLFYLDNFLSGGGQKGPGLNENYGRELLELHTLGVDGGYTQNDVRELARVLTGWSIDTPRIDPQFRFRPRIHDEGEKTVLGHHFAAGGGQDEGEQMLTVLSTHPSTAKFISTKLVRYFVNDNPPPALVNKVAQVFLKTDGDLTAVYRTIFQSPQFWSRANFRTKIKNPFQYIVSSIRALGGEVETAAMLQKLLNEMGEPLYRCQPPTGYKDLAAAWVNPGALVERLNFGLALGANSVPGVYTQLPQIRIPANTLAKSPQVLVKTMEFSILHHPLSPTSRKVVIAEFSRDGSVMADGEVRPLSVAKAAGLILGSPEFQRH